jgi:hypothetical protein
MARKEKGMNFYRFEGSDGRVVFINFDEVTSVVFQMWVAGAAVMDGQRDDVSKEIPHLYFRMVGENRDLTFWNKDALRIKDELEIILRRPVNAAFGKSALAAGGPGDPVAHRNHALGTGTLHTSEP